MAAVGFALKQYKDAREQTGELRTIVPQLDAAVDRLGGNVNEAAKNLRQELSTRSVGTFPSYLPAIVELVRSARKSIRIFCDHPAYGVFSDPATYVEYRSAVSERARNGVPVFLLHLEATARDELHRDQFTRPGVWGTPETNRAVADFLRRWTAGPTDPQPSLDDFLPLLNDVHERELDETFALADKTPTSEIMPLYFWIADDEQGVRRAVFAVASFRGGDLEVGFSTQDQTLIQALDGIYDRYAAVTERDRPAA